VKKIRRPALQNAALVLVSIALTIFLFDIVARRFVTPSQSAYGEIFGRELPPRRIVMPVNTHQVQDPTAPFRRMVVDGKQITLGDLWGHVRLDSVTGYTYQANAASKNGWWQSNNVGARTRENASAERPSGRTRVLVFGESFAHGSRLRQESAFPTVIGDRYPEFEVLNFAVDGFSMAQSFLRYRQVREQLKYDVVILMFVPETDPWREVNALRQLAYPDWVMPILPRFILSHGDLMLVLPLYADPFDLFQKNSEGLSQELRQYLLKYDRYYFPEMYEEPYLIGKTILWKLLANSSSTRRRRELEDNLLNPNREALQVSRAIFDAMQKEVKADGATFILAILPYQHHWWKGTTQESDTATWRRMVSFVCAPQTSCVDLLPEMLKIPPSEVDRVYDDEHFGPKMNLHIATLVHDTLRRLAPLHGN